MNAGRTEHHERIGVLLLYRTLLLPLLLLETIITITGIMTKKGIPCAFRDMKGYPVLLYPGETVPKVRGRVCSRVPPSNPLAEGCCDTSNPAFL